MAEVSGSVDRNLLSKMTLSPIAANGVCGPAPFTDEHGLESLRPDFGRATYENGDDDEYYNCSDDEPEIHWPADILREVPEDVAAMRSPSFEGLSQIKDEFKGRGTSMDAVHTSRPSKTTTSGIEERKV